MSNFDQQREAMVQHQLKARGIRDERVLEAMRLVPRELFVPKNCRHSSYSDGPLPIEAGQTISQPYIVALMAEALNLRETDRVLEVGAGSGYAAAVLGQIAKAVYAIEYYDELATLARQRMAVLGYHNVEIKQGDGAHGWGSRAPFDAILVSAAAPEVPPTLLEQLAVGGCMVMPVGAPRGGQELLRVRKTEDRCYQQESLGGVQFVPLVGGTDCPRD